MKRIIFLLAILLLVVLFLPSNALSAGVSTEELMENAEKFDGKVVTIKGEAIGDIMQRKDKQLVNILDNGTAIGVWGSKNTDLKQKIEFTGSYKTKGDLVQVTGVFNRVCTEHGGDIDIHADNIEILKKGERIKHSMDVRRVQTAVLLSIAAVLALIFNYLRSRKYL